LRVISDQLVAERAALQDNCDRLKTGLADAMNTIAALEAERNSPFQDAPTEREHSCADLDEMYKGIWDGATIERDAANCPAERTTEP